MNYVKATYRGEEIYGQVVDGKNDIRVGEARRNGYEIVRDINGCNYKVMKSTMTEIKLEADGSDEYSQYVQRKYLEAKEVSDRLPDDGKLHVGAMITTPVADGFAFYVVTKVTSAYAVVEWRAYDIDEWRSPTLGYGGAFQTDLINHVVQIHKQFDRIFG